MSFFEEQGQKLEKISTLQQTKVSTLSVLSLFAGCGGLDLGFQGNFHSLGKNYPRNPFQVVWANEKEPQATETYRHNLGEHIHCKLIQDVRNEELPYADVVLGGFPCQDFSVCGKLGGLTVERGRLYLEMKRVIETVKPILFVAENVKNLLYMENGLVFQTIKEDFASAGYTMYHHLFHAADYGVPQNRERVFLIGVRNDVPIIPYLPLETRTPETWVTSKEAVDDLWGKEDNPTILNHKMISRCKFVAGRKTQGNVRIKADKVSPTIRSEHHGNIEGHYRTTGDESDVTNWRRLSVRECARLQTFPDSFLFKRTATEAYKQIGNAVPPVLAWHIARALALSLEGHDLDLYRNKKILKPQALQMSVKKIPKKKEKKEVYEQLTLF